MTIEERLQQFRDAGYSEPTLNYMISTIRSDFYREFGRYPVSPSEGRKYMAKKLGCEVEAEPMTLDEAIQHCKEKGCKNNKCSREHLQLANWLKELKEYRARYGSL